MSRRDLITRLDGMRNRCQCTDATHNGEPCAESGHRFTTEQYFGQICDGCSAVQHGPIIVYDCTTNNLCGQIRTADKAKDFADRCEDLPDEDWPREGTLREALALSVVPCALQDGWLAAVQRQADGTWHLSASGLENENVDTVLATLESVEDRLDSVQGLSMSAGSADGWYPYQEPLLDRISPPQASGL